MSLNVGQLIKELKKYPANSKVAFASHDLNENEIDGLVHGVIDLVDAEDECGNSAYRDYGPMPVIRG